MCLFLLVAPGTQKRRMSGLWGQNVGVRFWLQSEHKCYLPNNCDTRLNPFSPPSLLVLTNDHCSIDINTFKRNKADRADGWCLLATTSPFAKPDILCDCVSLPNYPLFFSSPSLSTFASKKSIKKREREEEVLVFAWHEVSTFHFPGLPHQQREYTWPRRKEEEQKQCRDKKKCKNRPQRGEKREGGAVRSGKIEFVWWCSTLWHHWPTLNLSLCSSWWCFSLLRFNLAMKLQPFFFRSHPFENVYENEA